MIDEERKFFEAEINRQYNWYNKGSRLWSALHHWSLGISAVFSALATVVIKIGWLKEQLPSIYSYRDDIVACLAFLATLITAVGVAGGFGRKWQTNRVSRGRIERVRIAMSDPNADAKSIREELQDIIKNHDESIIGSSVK
jgi:hypothetical protein